MAINNESIGISAEVAIAKSFGVAVNPDYEARAEQEIVDLLLKNSNVNKIFEKEGIPEPQKHIAEGQNPVDFVLKGDKTLSVKTNQKALGRVAPQKIGQPTSETYFEYLEDYFSDFRLKEMLKVEGLVDTYKNRTYIFKKMSMNRTAELMDMYWKNLFDCDYYLHLYNLENRYNPLNNYLFLRKGQPPVWDNSKFSFTQTLGGWKECCTLKYCGISMGVFQVHNNRNCFKFRFTMKGITELMSKGLL